MKQLLNQVFNWKHIQRLILPLALMILATQLVASQRSLQAYIKCQLFRQAIVPGY